MLPAVPLVAQAMTADSNDERDYLAGYDPEGRLVKQSVVLLVVAWR